MTARNLYVRYGAKRTLPPFRFICFLSFRPCGTAGCACHLPASHSACCNGNGRPFAGSSFVCSVTVGRMKSLLLRTRYKFLVTRSRKIRDEHVGHMSDVPVDTPRAAQLLPGIGDATALGYSRGEIRDYVFDEAEQDRVRAIADDRLAARGASPTMMEGYCTVGREEIAAGSAIGRLLR